MERIGVLGGTFNPIHIGHLAIAQMALERMHLTKVIFMPAHMPPHKNSHAVAGAKYRYHMVRLAIEGNQDFEVSDFEIAKRGKSYTIDTMQHLRQQYVDAKLYFIIGGDTLSQLPSWRYIDDIRKIAEFIVVNRPGCVKKSHDIKHHSVIMPGIDISSSYVRMRLFQQRTVRYFVPEPVLNYIKENHIYET
ncbi:MAG TPA: nicotinate-nucleotide adenylyltransferase [Candidatus Omnitrophota bacterium]|nr:nicotinate-nucleotide adenylyltransferase [Candidatus Omnitrophota bacterium]HQL40745.1 nicotinate-nucleotide adenylyltransferase [Candidatus Omnitrophota bacterium]